MFDDVLTSSRGPGIVGTLIAVFVLAGFCGLGMAVFNQDGPVSRFRKEVQEQEAQIGDLKKTIESREERLNKIALFEEKAAEASLQKKLLNMRQKRVASLSEKRTDLESDVATLNESIESYRAAYRSNERDLAKGEMIDLSGIRGADYKNVKILTVNAIEMRVLLVSGPKGIPADELPADLQDRFQFDDEESAAFGVAMAEAQAQRKANAAKWQKEKEALKAASKAASRANAIAFKRRQIEQKRAYINKKVKAARAWEGKASEYHRKASSARQRGNISMDSGNARRAESKARSLRSAARRAQNEVSKLQKEINELRHKK